jgi:hypothetical protein
MTWSDVCAVLPVVLSQPARVESAARIELELARQCPGMHVLRANQFWERTPKRSLPFQRIASALRQAHGTVVLYLEDDAILAPDFGVQLRAVIDERLDMRARTAVSLFSIVSKADGYHASARPFCYAQCLLMPVWLAHEWGKTLARWGQLDRTRSYGFAPDICFGEVCDAHGVELLVRYPSLVQHADLVSACGHTHCPRSPTFR